MSTFPTFSTDPALYIFTSLTAGSSHIVTATSRLETILRANRVPFKAVDLATSQEARRLWARRGGKDPEGRVRKLPALVQDEFVVGDLVEIEDWNEYGELKQHVKIFYDEFTIPNINNKPPEPIKFKPAKKPAAATAAAAAGVAAAAAAAASSAATPAAKAKSADAGAKSSGDDKSKKEALPIRSIADEAAQKAKELRLKSLREKVAEDQKREKAKAAADPKESVKSADTEPQGKNIPGLQSPTSSAWRNSDATAVARDLVQSPTSARWKQGTEPGSPTSHRGTAAPASKGPTKSVSAVPVKPPVAKKAEEEDEDDSDEEDDEDDEEDSDEDDSEKDTKKQDTGVRKPTVATSKTATKKEEDEEDEEEEEDSDEEEDSGEEDEHTESNKAAPTTEKKDIKAEAKPKVDTKEEEDDEEDDGDDDDDSDSDDSDEEDEAPPAKATAPITEKKVVKAPGKPNPAVKGAEEEEEEEEDSDDSDKDEAPAKKK